MPRGTEAQRKRRQAKRETHKKNYHVFFCDGRKNIDHTNVKDKVILAFEKWNESRGVEREEWRKPEGRIETDEYNKILYKSIEDDCPYVVKIEHPDGTTEYHEIDDFIK